FLLINNVILVVATLMVLLGTLYPMVLDALTDTMVSVGPPYFNALFVPLMVVLMLALGVGGISRWKDTPVKWLVSMLKWVLVLAALGAVGLAIWVGDHHLTVGSMLFLVLWVTGSALRDILDKTRNKGLLRVVRALPRSYWGMYLADVGIAVCAVVLVCSSHVVHHIKLRIIHRESQERVHGLYQF